MAADDAAEQRELERLLGLTFSDPVAATAWLEREVPMLDGQRPCDLIARGALRPVIEVLAGWQAGVFP